MNVVRTFCTPHTIQRLASATFGTPLLGPVFESFGPVQMRCQIVFLTVATMLFCSTMAAAQTTLDISNITQTPKPGTPHDYLKDMSEIVNIANGQLSIRVGAPRPSELGALQQNAYAYKWDSGNLYSPTPVWSYAGNSLHPLNWLTLTQLWWQPQTSASNAPGQLAGSTVTFPFLIGNPPAHQSVICTYHTGYTYTDPDGGSHPMGLLWGQGQEFQNCQLYYGGTNIQQQLTGGDLQYKARVLFGADGSYQGIHVYDIHGNLVSSWGPTFQARDTNGNTRSSSGRYTPAQLVDGLSMPASITAPLSIPGLGGNFVYSNTPVPTGSTSNIPAAANQFTLITPDSNGLTLMCGTNATWTATNSVAKMPGYASETLTLPNLQKYTFQYDLNYGKINQITYPTGARVKYVWGVNPQSEGMILMNPGNNDGLNQGIVMSPTYCRFRYNPLAVQSRIVSYDGINDALEQDFSYQTSWSGSTSVNWTTKTTTVTTTDLLSPNSPSYKTVYTYIPGYSYSVPFSATSTQISSPTALESTIAYYDTQNNLLKTVTKTWTDNDQMSGECVTLPNGRISGAFYSYLPYVWGGLYSAAVTTDLVTDKAEYDFGNLTSCVRPATTPTRETVTAYHTFGITPYEPGYSTILDRPDSVKVYDHGTLISETDYGYDGFATAQVSPQANLHDETNYGATSAAPRGNVTSVRRRCLQSSGCVDMWTNVTYDETGQPTSVMDGNGNFAQVQHADSFTSDDGSPPSGYSANIYVTAIKHPDGSQESFQWDYEKGALRVAVDVNHNSTMYSYNDPWARITETDYPDLGKRQVYYNDTSAVTTPYNPLVQVTTLMNASSGKVVKTSISDPYGHPIQSQLNSDPFGPVYSDTTYNGFGQVATVTTPYRSKADVTYGLTSLFYDSLDRKTMQLNPDQSLLQWCYDGIPSSGQTNCSGQLGSVPGEWVDSTDENGNDWQRTTDGLGRLRNVFEPGGATSFPSLETDYSYDGLSNLLSVTQHGNSGDVARARTFTYSSLSQLLTAINPESGQSSYTYDGNGNVITKSAPAVNVSSGVSVIGYSYDCLNRVVSKWSAAPPAGNCSGVAPTASSTLLASYIFGMPGAPGNTVGRLIDERAYLAGSVTSEGQFSSYDTMGRLQAEQQNPFSPNGTNYQFLYAYDLMGNLTCANNGFAMVTSASTCKSFTAMPYSISELFGYDSAGRLSSETIGTQPWGTAAYPANLFQATSSSPAAYDPMGHLVNGLFAINGSTSAAAIQVKRNYDNRGRILNETDMGNGTTAGAAGSAGILTVSGLEAGPVTATATSGTGTLSVTGADGSQVVCTTTTVYEGGNGQYPVQITTCNSVPDTGSLGVTLGGFTATASYGSGTSDSSIASQLANSFNASGSPVTAIASGSNVTLTAKSKGSATNYPITFANGGGYTVSDPKASLAGGHDAGTVYDAGIATVSIVNGGTTYAASYSWKQGDTASTIATELVSSIKTAAGAFLSAQLDPNSGDILLRSSGTGLATDYSVTATVTDSQKLAYPTYFQVPSFTISAESMAGGEAAGTLYAYQVPTGGYAPNGNILSQTDSVMGTWNYGYDTLNRLTGTVAGPNVPSTLAGLYGCWNYDAFGNRTLEAYSTASSTPCSSGATVNAQYTATPVNTTANNNRLSSAVATYDGAGNVIQDSRNAYVYDPEGRLCAVEQLPVGIKSYTQYLYDAEGRRVAKGTVNNSASSPSCGAPIASNGFSLTNQYLLNQGGDQVTELGPGANPATNWLHSNIWQGGRLTGTYTSTGLHFDIADPLGTKRVQATVSSLGLGVAELNCLSLPFGNDIGNTLLPGCIAAGVGGTDATEHHYTGKERDTESGNDYFGDRYFASTMGRFLSPDPGPWKLDDPQYFNMYSYALNNPLRNVDEEGDTAQDRVNKANELASQNIPYVSGGGHPGNKMETCGLDCSGLVHTVFKADPDNTLSVNGSAATEATQFQDGGQFSTDIGDAQPGDAIFFSNSSGTIVHTGIVVDVRDGKVYFVHAPRPGKNVNRFYIKVSDLKLGDEKFAGLGRSNERGTTPTAQNRAPSLNLWSAFMGFFVPAPPPPAAPKPPSENPHRHKGPVPCLKNRDGSCAS